VKLLPLRWQQLDGRPSRRLPWKTMIIPTTFWAWWRRERGGSVV